MSEQKKLVVPTEEEVDLFGNKIKVVMPNKVPNGYITGTSNPEYITDKYLVKPKASIGQISARAEIKVAPVDMAKGLSPGWRVNECIGMGVINSRGLIGTFNTKPWDEEIRDIINDEKEDD